MEAEVDHRMQVTLFEGGCMISCVIVNNLDRCDGDHWRPLVPRIGPPEETLSSQQGVLSTLPSLQ